MPSRRAHGTSPHQHPDGVACACSEDEDAKERKAAEAVKLSKREKIRLQREALPAFAYKDEFVKAVFEHQILIIVAETGAGKTTQLPQYLLEAGFGEAGVHCLPYWL
jgi:pre-mRNA-splicing factor ATP-dependent RNA helicase DHX16